MRVAALVGGCCVALSLAGCTNGTVDGRSEPAGVASGEPAFSPCDDIPDDTLRGLGLDPETEERDILGVRQPGWKVCSWQADRYSVSVLATTHTIDDLRAFGENRDFVDVEIGGRTGTLYRKVADREGKRCDVAIPTPGGVVLLFVGFHTLVTPRNEREPCEVVLAASASISPVLPK